MCSSSILAATQRGIACEEVLDFLTGAPPVYGFHVQALEKTTLWGPILLPYRRAGKQMAGLTERLGITPAIEQILRSKAQRAARTLSSSDLLQRNQTALMQRPIIQHVGQLVGWMTVAQQPWAASEALQVIGLCLAMGQHTPQVEDALSARLVRLLEKSNELPDLPLLHAADARTAGWDLGGNPSCWAAIWGAERKYALRDAVESPMLPSEITADWTQMSQALQSPVTTPAGSRAIRLLENCREQLGLPRAPLASAPDLRLLWAHLPAGEVSSHTRVLQGLLQSLASRGLSAEERVAFTRILHPTLAARHVAALLPSLRSKQPTARTVSAQWSRGRKQLRTRLTHLPGHVAVFDTLAQWVGVRTQPQ